MGYYAPNVIRQDVSIRNISVGGQSSPLFWLSSACRGVYVPAVEEDNRTGLALCLACLGCQGSCGIVPNGPTSLHSGFFSTRQVLKC